MPERPFSGEAAPPGLHLQGIATTRAGCCVTSDTRVVRDLLYTGQPVQERCSVVLRIAPTFLRFGSFEICKLADKTTGPAAHWRSWPSHCRPVSCLTYPVMLPE